MIQEAVEQFERNRRNLAVIDEDLLMLTRMAPRVWLARCRVEWLAMKRGKPFTKDDPPPKPEWDKTV